MKYSFNNIRFILLPLLKYIIQWLILLFHSFQPKNNVTIILKLDSIGDYILFRNFLIYLKNSKYCKNKKLILVGNYLWKDLALTFDKNIIDEFLWIDFSIKNKKYYKKIFTQIANYKCETIINPTHSRTRLVNNIIYHSKAKYRITSVGDDICLNKTLIKFSNYLLFNKRIGVPDTSHFEFERNKYFFEQLINEKINITQPSFANIHHIPNYIISIFPGASQPFRRWHHVNFAALIQKIYVDNPMYEFQILGAESDSKIAELIIENLPKNIKCINLCGTTNLNGLVQKIANSSLLIANETGATHLAVAVKTPTVCISNGNHFGRFCPYSKHITTKIETVFPHKTFYDTNYFAQYAEAFRYQSDLNINDIAVITVFEKVIKLLNN